MIDFLSKDRQKMASSMLLPTSPTEQETIVKGEGSWLISEEGKRMLDLGAGQVCATFGHSENSIVNKLKAQLDKLIHCGARFYTPELYSAAERVLSITPDELTKVCFLNTGTESNEFAIRLAKCATQRTWIASPENGYLGTSHLLRGLYSPFLEEISTQPKPQNCLRFPLLYNANVEDAFKAFYESLYPNREKIAAVIMEPILGTRGIHLLPQGLLKKIQGFCKDYGILLILDEAQTGMGRTGSWFFCEQEDVTPDILVFSKCAGNGFPVSCIVLREEIAESILDKGWFYISSHASDPLACAAVSATIDFALNYKAPAKAQELGDIFLTSLRHIASKSKLIKVVRGKGLMLGIEWEDFDNEYSSQKICRRVFQKALKLGVILGYGDWGGVMRLTPPLTISKEEIKFTCEILQKVEQETLEEIEVGVKFPQWNSPTTITKHFLNGLNTFVNNQKITH